MILGPVLTTLAVAMPVDPTAAEGSKEAPLGLTATVIRPVAVPASIGEDAGAFTVGETAAIEVDAVGATVSPSDGDRVVVTPDGSNRITITLVY